MSDARYVDPVDLDRGSTTNSLVSALHAVASGPAKPRAAADYLEVYHFSQLKVTFAHAGVPRLSTE